LIVSNDEGEVLVIENEKLHEKIKNVFCIPGEDDSDEEKHGISALCVFGNPSKGFIAGSPHG
jgi:hypothetical protein